MKVDRKESRQTFRAVKRGRGFEYYSPIPFMRGVKNHEADMADFRLEVERAKKYVLWRVANRGEPESLLDVLEELRSLWDDEFVPEGVVRQSCMELKVNILGRRL